jgi:DNA-binding MarR family transcriptional regulator
MTRRLGDAEYARLLEFRTGLRRFLRWSEQQAAAAGLTPAQHQLLLAVRGHREPDRDRNAGHSAGSLGPTIGDVADHLLLRHHSAVELVDRAESAGLVERRPDPTDQRQVRLVLTAAGEERLEHLSAVHVEELARLGAALRSLTEGLDV